MPDTFTTSARLRKIEVGTREDEWAPPVSDGLNDGVILLLDQVIAGRGDIDVASGNVTLVASDGASDTQRPMFLRATGAPGVARNITVPDSPTQKLYLVENRSDDTVTIKTVSGTGVVINVGRTGIVFVDSVNDEVFPVQFLDDIAFQMPDWTTGTVDVEDATAGDTTLTYRYAVQANADGSRGYAAFQLPEFSSTITPGAPFTTITLSPNTPASFPAEMTGVSPSDFVIWMQEGGTPNMWFALSPADTLFPNILLTEASGTTVANGTVMTLPHNLTLTWPLG